MRLFLVWLELQSIQCLVMQGMRTEKGGVEYFACRKLIATLVEKAPPVTNRAFNEYLELPAKYHFVCLNQDLLRRDVAKPPL